MGSSKMMVAGGIRIIPEVQGHHSYIPPVDSIVREVLKWLSGLLPDNEAVFGLQIECNRIPVRGNFTGVRPFGIAVVNQSTLEIRVKPPDSDHQWHCHLPCPDIRIRNQIWETSHPDALQLSEKVIDEINNEFGCQITGLFNSKSRKAKDFQKEANMLLKTFVAENARNKLCYMISQKIPETEELVEAELIRSVVTQIVGRGVTKYALRLILSQFILDNIFDPIDVNDLSVLRVTCCFDQMAKMYLEDQAKAEKAQEYRKLTQLIAELEKGVDKADHLIAKYQRSIDEQMAEKNACIVRLNEARAKLEQLESDD